MARRTGRRPRVFETTFSSYRVVKLLGQGGAGSVYEVEDASKTRFALKLLDPASSNTERRRRFKNEIAFCQRADHRNIVGVLDHGVATSTGEPTPFYVMKLYEKSLRHLIEAGLDREQAIRYFEQLLDGAEAAHLMGVVHRDLKPENILYDPAGDHVLIADFGIAHFSHEDLATLVETKPTSRLANFRYAAPEQREAGAAVDHRCDIFALGLILHEMLTGVVPHGTGYRLIASIHADLGYLDAVVSSMLHNAPAERIPAVAEIKRVLIGQRHKAVVEQKLSDLQKVVVPAGEIDEPLALNPPQISDFDWEGGKLSIILDQPVNARWVRAFENIPNHEALLGKGPGQYTWEYDRAWISAEDHQVQQLINYFKQWLPLATQVYASDLRREANEQERAARQRLEAREAELEKQRKLRQTIRI